MSHGKHTSDSKRVSRKTPKSKQPGKSIPLKPRQSKPIGKPFIMGKKINAPVKKRISNASKKHILPKTAKISRSKTNERPTASRAHSGMSIEELQNMAKSRGIPFGGLHIQQLVRKINNYF